jgi:hypothetical protein
MSERQIAAAMKLVLVSMLASQHRSLSGAVVLSVPADATEEEIRDLAGDLHYGGDLDFGWEEEDSFDMDLETVDIEDAEPGAVPDATVSRDAEGFLRLDDDEGQSDA